MFRCGTLVNVMKRNSLLLQPGPRGNPQDRGFRLHGRTLAQERSCCVLNVATLFLSSREIRNDLFHVLLEI